MLELLNLKLEELDIAMKKTLDNIHKLSIPNDNDLKKLYNLYKETITCYKKNNTVYKLNILKYTDLYEVTELLKKYNYLKENDKINQKNNISLNDLKNKENDTTQISFNSSSTSDNNSPNKNKTLENDDIFIEQKNPFNANGPVYAFTNEALSQYMKNYDFTNKTVLASLGSGDFALNSYLLDASTVDTFDINLYTYSFYKLKIALILKYDYKTFCKLIKNPTQIFENFEEYKDLLDNSNKIFFEKLLKIYKGNYNALLKKIYIDKVGEEKNQWNESNTFDTLEELFLIAQYKNYYLQSEENYNKLKEKIKKDNNDEFFFVDLYKFVSNKKYDIIYLSNIGDYHKSEEEFNEFVLSLRENLLNENGIIIVVSITNHIMINPNIAIRTKMDSDDLKKFNEKYEGIAHLPYGNSVTQNVYTTFPYEKNNNVEFNIKKQS